MFCMFMVKIIGDGCAKHLLRLPHLLRLCSIRDSYSVACQVGKRINTSRGDLEKHLVDGQ